ncbi:shikimate dehydrogenase [Arthrobacter sp. V4I6]|uniref:shikimate dehydrogenase family protein n=1 Tax=unclassified Arthrobacter TaxID=235627 RepID=UPI00278A53B3|nr:MULTISPECIES: shikimate dehydrogenase [unclassified Arthrobacter]MDQ0820897.1 shikimate dehydrogenase [Arthrobacter sp. V1I7]MDQ0855159.1 shikimate dehydrogenase [Arthrobacter sp. V4I6]
MTLRAAVLGHPISHSKSPALHRAAYAHLGVEIAYSAIDVTEEDLPALMARVREDARHGEGWRGLSVTMPLKTAMVAEVDEVRGVARALGVINTVAFEPSAAGGHPVGNTPGSPRLVGYNTDVAGIVNALRHAGASAAPTAAILGGGGTAAAAIAALRELGAPGADVFVRDVGRAVEARAASAAVGLPIRVRPITGAAAGVAAADVVISTLPPRAADTLAAELQQAFAGERAPETARNRPGVLLDVAYDPWPSRIAAAWQDAGGTVVPGLEMLIYQAVEQVRHFSRLGDAVPEEVIDVMCVAVGAPRRVF